MPEREELEDAKGAIRIRIDLSLPVTVFSCKVY